MLGNKAKLTLNIPNISKSFPFRRKEALVILLWGVVLGIVVSEVYWVGYQTIPLLYYYKQAYGWYETPNPTIWDLLLVLVVSVFFGALISDTKALFYGYIVGMILAFLLSFIYVLFYMWNVLRLEYLFTFTDFNWEWAVLFAIWNVGKIMFPQVIFLSLLGVVFGALIRERFGY